MKKYLVIIFLLAVTPLLLLALSKSQELRGKAAVNEVVVYGNPNVTDITQTQATVRYTTTGKTTTFIAYDIDSTNFTGAVTNMGRWRVENDQDAQTIHSHLLSGLAPGTTYFFIVSGYDTTRGLYISPSEVLSFRTVEANKDCSKTDFNNDGKTDLNDAALLQNCLNVMVTGGCKNFDLNGDGKIDQADLSLVTNCF